MRKQPITILIPVYRNNEIFYRFLESNRKYFSGCEVIILNDYPKENITKPVKKIYPEAAVVNNKKNLGFSGNVNQGILKAKGSYILLMNSDVLLQNDDFVKAIDRFKKDKKLFAVGFGQIETDNKIVGANRGYFKNGLINHEHVSISDFSSSFFNFWAEGGASLFRKKILIDLGLFDELYNPFYWEDVDLSYRAWKTGYKVLFDSGISVKHQHETTIGRYFDNRNINRIALRNQLIFQWKNLTDSDLILNHLLNIWRFIFKLGFFDALLLIPKILKSRNQTVKFFIKSDKEILSYFK